MSKKNRTKTVNTRNNNNGHLHRFKRIHTDNIVGGYSIYWCRLCGTVMKCLIKDFDTEIAEYHVVNEPDDGTCNEY
jgi:hypothetical protein